MGTTVLVRSYTGKFEKLADYTSDMQSQDAHEDGHLYSGSWGSLCGGVDIRSEIFVNFEVAEDFISEEHSKGESPMAVRVLCLAKGKKGFSEYNKLFQKLDKLRGLAGFGEGSIIKKSVQRALNAKSSTKSCKACGTRHPIHNKFLIRPICSCGEPYLLNAAERERLDSIKQEISGLEAELMTFAQSQPKDAPCFSWAVGGNCPS